MKLSPNHTASALPAAFGKLAWSNLLAQCAEQIGLCAAPLVAVFALGASAAQTGLLQTAQTLPFLLMALPMGVWADRRPGRGLMAAAEAIRALTMFAVLLLLASHQLTLSLLALCGFIGAAGTVAYNVAAPSLVRSLVLQRDLPAANGRIELARSVAYSAGPALGGALVGWLGGGWAYGLATVMSAFAVALLRRLPEQSRPPAKRQRFWNDLKEGAHFVFRHELLRPMLFTAFFFNFGYFVLQAIYVAYAARHLGMSSSAIGVSLAAYGAGMVGGALLGPAISRRMDFGPTLAIGPCCGFIASVVMLATVWLPYGWLACASFFILGAGPILWTISSTTLRQTVTPPEMLGRVSAIISTLTYGARPAGALASAYLALAVSINACLVACVAAFTVQLLILVTSPVVRLGTLPEMAVPQ